MTGCAPPPAGRPVRFLTAASRRARPIRTRHIPEPAQPLRASRFFSDLGLNLSIFCSFEHQKMWPKPTTRGGVHGDHPLTSRLRHGVYVAHEHRRPQNPSLVARLLKVAGAILFLQSLEAVIAVRRPIRLS